MFNPEYPLILDGEISIYTPDRTVQAARVAVRELREDYDGNIVSRAVEGEVSVPQEDIDKVIELGNLELRPVHSESLSIPTGPVTPGPVKTLRILSQRRAGQRQR